jgi:hypothetical protein
MQHKFWQRSNAIITCKLSRYAFSRTSLYDQPVPGSDQCDPCQSRIGIDTNISATSHVLVVIYAILWAAYWGSETALYDF